MSQNLVEVVVDYTNYPRDKVLEKSRIKFIDIPIKIFCIFCGRYIMQINYHFPLDCSSLEKKEENSLPGILLKVTKCDNCKRAFLIKIGSLQDVTSIEEK